MIHDADGHRRDSCSLFADKSSAQGGKILDNRGGDRRLAKNFGRRISCSADRRDEHEEPFGLMYEGYFEPSADTLQMPGLNKNFSELRAPTNGSEKVNDPSHNSCSFSGNEGEAGEQKHS